MAKPQKSFSPVPFVRVGSVIYQIFEVESLYDEDSGEYLFGKTMSFDAQPHCVLAQKTRMNDCNETLEDISTEAKLNTLLHEINHMIYYQYQIGELGARREEPFIILSTNVMLQVMIDNPKLMKYVDSSLCQIRANLKCLSR